MRLSDVLSHLPLPSSCLAQDVRGVSADTRTLQPSDLFFAIPGTKRDGSCFAQEAQAAGAIAMVSETPPGPDHPTDFPCILVPNVRWAYALAARAFFPQQPRYCVAVTGTSGKTSVANFTQQIWGHLGKQAAALGTMGLISPSGDEPGSLTTPDPLTLHQKLHTLAKEGVTHVALEASSHGLHQYRLDALELCAGAFTHLSRDHLDYHADMQAYLQAKLMLFDRVLPREAKAVICSDSLESEQVLHHAKARGLPCLTIGQKEQDDIFLSRTHPSPQGVGTYIDIRYKNEIYSIYFPLLGDFMISNALVAAGLCLSTGEDPTHVFPALSHLKGVKGRLELVAHSSHHAPILVDYAHKPDALFKVLTTLRPLTKGRLLVVLGCGGDRDKGKRPLMGRLAAQLADIVMITDDNPRSEDPAAIRADMKKGAQDIGKPLYEIGDRKEAIEYAISLLKAGDLLLVAGKGHETGQIMKDHTLPFSDHAIIRACVDTPP